eukprot:g32390.t1
MYGDTPYCNVFVDNVTGLLRNYWCKTRDQNATLEQVKQLQACSLRMWSGDEVGEPEREVKDTETSALPTEATDQGVDGGDAGVVRGVQAELKTRGALLTLLPQEWKTREIGMECRFHGMEQL